MLTETYPRCNDHPFSLGDMDILLGIANHNASTLHGVSYGGKNDSYLYAAGKNYSHPNPIIPSHAPTASYSVTYR